MPRDVLRATRLTRALLRGGVAAGPAFLTTALIAGAVRRDYRPLRHPVSTLALGPGGRLQVTNFVVTGGLYLGFAVGLARSSGPRRSPKAVPILVGSAGVGLIGAGVFVTDPVSGYPPGTPDQGMEPTVVGWLHQVFSLPVLVGLPAAAAIEAAHAWRRGNRVWALYSAKSAAVSLITFGLASAGFGQQPRLVDRAGLVPADRRRYDVRLADCPGCPPAARSRLTVLNGAWRLRRRRLALGQQVRLEIVRRLVRAQPAPAGRPEPTVGCPFAVLDLTDERPVPPRLRREHRPSVPNPRRRTSCCATVPGPSSTGRGWCR